MKRKAYLCNKQNLIYRGREIDEGHLLSEYDIEDSSVICVVRLRAMNADDLLVLDNDFMGCNRTIMTLPRLMTKENALLVAVLNIADRVDGNVLQSRWPVNMEMKSGLVRAIVPMNGQYHIMEHDMTQQQPLHRLAMICQNISILHMVDGIYSTGADIQGVSQYPMLNRSLPHEQDYLVQKIYSENRVNPRNMKKVF